VPSFVLLCVQYSTVCTMFYCVYDVLLCVPCSTVRTIFYCVYDVLLCVRSSNVCTMFYCVYDVLLCVQCSTVCTMFYCVYDVLLCVRCSTVCTMFYFVYDVLLCVRCSTVCTIFFSSLTLCNISLLFFYTIIQTHFIHYFPALHFKTFKVLRNLMQLKVEEDLQVLCTCTLCDSANINTIIEFRIVYDKLLKPRQSFRITLYVYIYIYTYIYIYIYIPIQKPAHLHIGLPNNIIFSYL